MLVKAALVVLILASLLTAGMDDQQTAAVPAAETEAIQETEFEKQAIKTISANEKVSGWADEITPITFVLYR